MTTSMQMPKPTKFHKKLETLIGDWSGDETMHPMPWDPAGGKAKGRYKIRAALGGFGIVEDYEQKRGGQVTYTGHGVMGYDGKQGCYVWHWSDSMGGVPDQVSRGTWTGNKLVFQNACEEGHGRYSFTFKKDGSVAFAIEHSQDGNTWTPFMDGTYTKKPAKS